MRVSSSDLLATDAHSACGPANECVSPSLRHLSKCVTRYVEALTVTLASKGRGKGDTWLLVFYSLCIQAYVRRAMIALEGRQRSTDAGVGTNRPSSVKYLHTAVSLFQEISLQNKGRLAEKVRNSRAPPSVFLSEQPPGPTARARGWEKWQEEGFNTYLGRIFQMANDTSIHQHTDSHMWKEAMEPVGTVLDIKGDLHAQYQAFEGYDLGQVEETAAAAFNFAYSDSGYGTMSRCSRGIAQAPLAVAALPLDSEQMLRPVDLARNEDDTKTVYSDTSSLSTSAVDKYAQALADDIGQKLSTMSTALTYQELGRISTVMPELLRALALNIGFQAASQMHRDVMVFIHKHRSAITESIQNYVERDLDPVSGRESKPSSSIVMLDRWLGSLDPGVGTGREDHLVTSHNAPSRPPMGLLEIGSQMDERERLYNSPSAVGSADSEAEELTCGDGEYVGEPCPPGIDAYSKFVRADSAYQWLIDRLHRELQLSRQEFDVMEEVRQQILSALPRARHQVSRKQPSQGCAVVYTVDWDPEAFLVEQNYQQPHASAILNAVTLTGSYTDVQALSCLNYMKQTWPQTGSATLSLVKQLLAGGKVSKATCK